MLFWQHCRFLICMTYKSTILNGTLLSKVGDNHSNVLIMQPFHTLKLWLSPASSFSLFLKKNTFSVLTKISNFFS